MVGEYLVIVNRIVNDSLSRYLIKQGATAIIATVGAGTGGGEVSLIVERASRGSEEKRNRDSTTKD